jgi:hypothetical protein
VAENACEYGVQGTRVDLQFSMGFKGALSGNGAAIVTGLPIQSQADTLSKATNGAVSIVVGVSGMQALGGPILLQPTSASTSAPLFMQGSTGQMPLTNANFGTSPVLIGRVTYFKN